MFGNPVLKSAAAPGSIALLTVRVPISTTQIIWVDLVATKHLYPNI
jgi:hypothetical protein